MKNFIVLILLIVSSTALSQAPTANFTVSDNAICEGECIEITNNSSDNSLSHSWTFNGGTPATYSGENPGSVCFQTAGSHVITLTVTNTFGTNTYPVTINVGAIPSVTATISDTLNGAYVEIPDTTIHMFQEAYLYAEGTPAGGTLTWYPNGVVNDAIQGASGDSLVVKPFYDTYYVVTYTTANGCKSSDTVFVGVIFTDSVKVSLPNSFSPNADGENDYFRVLTNVDKDQNFKNGFYEGGAIVEVDFRIYDRFGHQVFRTINPHEGWDGTDGGKPVNSGTYAYLLNYRRIDGKSGELKGNVTLFR